MYGYFKQQISEISHQKKPKERNWISSNRWIKQRHEDIVKAKIGKTQQNCKFRLCGNRNETINHINYELVQKDCKTRHDRVDQVIQGEFAKSLNLNKWYTHNPESVLENETHNVPWVFESLIQHASFAEKKAERVSEWIQQASPKEIQDWVLLSR